jgi:hypothetical protein
VLIVSQGYWLVLNNFVDDAKRTREALTPYALLMDAAWAELRKELRAHLSVTVTVTPATTQGEAAAAPAGSAAPAPAASPTTTATSSPSPTTRGNDGESSDPPSDDVKTRLITKVQELEAGRGASLSVGATVAVATPLQTGGPTIHEMFTLKNTLDTDLKFISSMVLSPDMSDRGEGDFRNYFESFGLAYTDLLSFEKAQYILQLGTHFVLPVVYGLLGAAVFLVRRISEAYRLEYLSPSSPVDFSLRFFLGGVSGLAISWFITSGTPAAGVIASGPSSVIASLSPLVLSFVAGYAVELLFSLVDRVVGSFTDKGARRA